MLYVFDPVAMHNIVVKDQYIYEETAWFVKYVLQAHCIAFELPYNPMTVRFHQQMQV